MSKHKRVVNDIFLKKNKNGLLVRRGKKKTKNPQLTCEAIAVPMLLLRTDYVMYISHMMMQPI